MHKYGVVVNDLYNDISKDIDNYISNEDFIHLTEEGTNVAAISVATKIKEVIKGIAANTTDTTPIRTNPKTSVLKILI